MPTSQKNKEPTLEERIADARSEHEVTQRRVAELESELGEIPGKLQAVDWSTDEEQSIAAVGELEQRRNGLPHLIRHLRREEARQEIALLTLEMEEAEERRGPLNSRVEKLQAEFDKARQALNDARGELNELIYGELSDLRRGISEAEKRLWAIDNEPATEGAPPVRSVWQRNFAPDQDEVGATQDGPAAWRWDNPARVTDQPLSAGGGDRAPVAVVPERAIRQHKGGNDKGGRGT